MELKAQIEGFGSVRMADIDRFKAEKAFDEANDSLERWRSQHRVKTALGIDNKELFKKAVDAEEHFEEAKIKEHQIKQAYEADHLEATCGLELSKQRKHALEALIVEQIDIDAAIAEIDPASIEGSAKLKPKSKSRGGGYDMELRDYKFVVSLKFVIRHSCNYLNNICDVCYKFKN